MWDGSFFLASVEGPLFAHAPLSGKAAGTGRNFFFVNFDFISLSLSLVSYTLPWIMIPFIPTRLFFTDNKQTQTHEFKTPHHNVRESEQPPSLLLFCAVALSNNLYERFSVWLKNNGKTTHTHTSLHYQNLICPPTLLLLEGDFFELKEKEGKKKFWSVPCFFFH